MIYFDISIHVIMNFDHIHSVLTSLIPLPLIPFLQGFVLLLFPLFNIRSTTSYEAHTDHKLTILLPQHLGKFEARSSASKYHHSPRTVLFPWGTQQCAGRDVVPRNTTPGTARMHLSESQDGDFQAGLFCITRPHWRNQKKKQRPRRRMGEQKEKRGKKRKKTATTTKTWAHMMGRVYMHTTGTQL